MVKPIRRSLSRGKRLQQHLPEHLATWLSASGSLTQQLTQLADGQFHVERIAEHYQALRLQDAQWLKMPHHHVSWVRESYLFGHQAQPWVKAKSIFPIMSLNKRARIFKHIGNRPVGHYLFERTNPQCERRIILLEEGWTRQSCYTWHDCKFIVQETFLEAFERFIQA